MFLPPGFKQHSIATTLGQMVYYAPDASPWATPSTTEENRSAEGKAALEPLLFFHGFGGGSSAYEWSKVYPAFATDYRVLAPDLIGWGRSDRPARDYKIEDYLTTLTEFVERTCDRPVSVIASSLTAAFVIRVAIDRPDLFKSLILVTPSGLSDFGEDYTRSPFAQVVSTPILDRFLYSTVLATSFGIRTFLEQRQFARPERIYSEIVEAYLASAQQPNAEYAALSFVRGDLCFDLAHYITQLMIPTAILWGGKAQYTESSIGRRLANLNPEFVPYFEQIADVGLTPQLELPGVTIGLIRRCLSILS